MTPEGVGRYPYRRRIRKAFIMDYQAMYAEKLCTAEEAVKIVKDGDWVDYSQT